MKFGHDPFGTLERHMKIESHSGLGFERAVTGQSKEEAVKREAEQEMTAQAVSLPPHLYIPENAQSVDIRHVRSIDPATSNYPLMTFRGVQGATVRFIAYGIFNDGLLEDDYSFLPLVEGRRVFPYHGNPDKHYLISLGLAPDLSDGSMIGCQLTLNPGETLVWQVTNKSAVATAMGVRMKGYIDFTQRLITRRFGG